MVRSAKISEITRILGVTKACTATLVKKDIFQWNEHYASKQAFTKT
jgi:hypothetical protein